DAGPGRRPGGQRHLGRGERVLSAADGPGAGPPGRLGLPTADRGGVGVRLPRRDRHPVLERRPAGARPARDLRPGRGQGHARRGGAGPGDGAAPAAPGRLDGAEPIRAVRHARERLGVVRRPLRRQPAGGPRRVVAGVGGAVPVGGPAGARPAGPRAGRRVPGGLRPGQVTPSACRYVSSLNPTSNVFPTRAVGARRLPVGPSRCASSVSLSGRSDFRSNTATFFPRAATSRSTPASSFRASARPIRVFVALTVSRTSVPACPRNPWAFWHVVQDFRSYSQSIALDIRTPPARRSARPASAPPGRPSGRPGPRRAS